MFAVWQIQDESDINALLTLSFLRWQVALCDAAKFSGSRSFKIPSLAAPISVIENRIDNAHPALRSRTLCLCEKCRVLCAVVMERAIWKSKCATDSPDRVAAL